MGRIANFDISTGEIRRGDLEMQTAPWGYADNVKKSAQCKTVNPITKRHAPECYGIYLRFRPMTIAEARTLPAYGELHVLAHNGVIRRVRRNGAVKTWKRDPNRIEIPLKYGMYEAFRDTSRNGATMEHLVVLLDENGEPTNREDLATV